MQELKQKLIAKAIDKHKEIYPCSDKVSFDDCFTIHKDKLVFWYNDSELSTHILTESIATM